MNTLLKVKWPNVGCTRAEETSSKFSAKTNKPQMLQSYRDGQIIQENTLASTITSVRLEQNNKERSAGEELKMETRSTTAAKCFKIRLQIYQRTRGNAQHFIG